MSKKIILFLILLPYLLGFRIFGQIVKWPIKVDQPKIWLHICQDLEISNYDLPEGDPLYGQLVSSHDLLDSVIADYNSVSSSFLRFANQDTDSSFDASLAENRIIELCPGSLPGVVVGQARFDVDENGIYKCEIILSKSAVSAKQFVGTLTHELGHCVGLDHPHDTTAAIMSYYHSTNSVRLMVDDKMGLTSLYPLDPKAAQEEPTWGASCSPRSSASHSDI